MRQGGAKYAVTAEVTPNCFIVRDADGQQLPMSIMKAKPATAQQPSCSPATRPGGSRRISPSCRSY